MEQLFITATREKYRFAYKGICTTEDLWNLSLQALDDLYQQLNCEAKTIELPSLLTVKTQQSELLTKKIAIVRFIFKTKENEMKEKETAAAEAQKKQKIMSIIAAKRDEHLTQMPIEELEKLL
jgi:hypothetical protein